MRRTIGSIAAVLALAACGSSAAPPRASTVPATATETAAALAPDPALLHNIDHFVVLMQENRSYDSYFAQLDAPSLGYTNPDPTNPSGPPIAMVHNRNMCESADLAHGWNAVHDEIDGGKMDGFTAANVDPTDKSGARAMATYGPAKLPYYYALAQTFGIGDRYFASVPGPTYPNRYYLIAGTSFGHIDNTLPTGNGWRQKTVFEELDAAHVSWKIYNSQISVESLLFAYVRKHRAGHVVSIGQYFRDAVNGTLPQVAFVEPTFVGKVTSENDEHPPANPERGQQFSATVIAALMHSPEWSTSALVQTWDEHGGYFDHVPPPPAPKPDNIAPILGKGDTHAAFDRYGVRVPVLVVSPWSRAHFVSHTIHDHTSILRTIELRFGLPALTHRDAMASPLTEFFDFSHRTYAKPPTLPAATIDPHGASQCKALWGNKILGL